MEFTRLQLVPLYSYTPTYGDTADELVLYCPESTILLPSPLIATSLPENAKSTRPATSPIGCQSSCADKVLITNNKENPRVAINFIFIDLFNKFIIC